MRPLVVTNDMRGKGLADDVYKIDNQSFMSFEQDILSIGSDRKIVTIEDVQPVTDDLTIPENITLRFIGNGLLRIANTVTVTIEGTIEAGLHQIFSGGIVLFDNPNKLYEVYPQWWYSGSGSWTESIQAAINSLVGGGKIKLVRGLYTLSTFDVTENVFLYIRSDNITLEGDSGKATQLLIPDDVALDNVDAVIRSVNVSYTTVRGIYIYGNGHARNGKGGGIGCDGADTTGHLIENCIVENIQGTSMGFQGTLGHPVTNSKIRNNKLLGGNTDGIAQQWTLDCEISGNYITHIGSANDNYPIILEAGQAAVVKNNVCFDNIRGIVAAGSSNDCLIDGNTIQTSSPTGDWPCETAIYLINCLRNRIVNNRVHWCIGDGISLNGSEGAYPSHHTIMGNKFWNCQYSAIGIRTNDNHVIGNWLYDGGANGIVLAENACRNMVQGNFAYQSAPGAIVIVVSIAAGSNYNVIIDNIIPKLNTPIYDLGTGTTKRGNRWGATGVLCGRSVLVAGTVTVNNTEVVLGDSILLTRVIAGGTLGHLSVGTIVNNTSFVINSDNAADTSTIFWEIVH